MKPLVFIKPTGTRGTLKPTGDAARDKVVSEKVNLGYAPLKLPVAPERNPS